MEVAASLGIILLVKFDENNLEELISFLESENFEFIEKERDSFYFYVDLKNKVYILGKKEDEEIAKKQALTLEEFKLAYDMYNKEYVKNVIN